VAATVVTVVGAIVLVAVLVSSRAGRCGPGVHRHGGECVGVTDGRYSFSGDLRDVTDRIRAENQWVERHSTKNRPAVSIAYLLPIPHSEAALSATYRHELQGAYVAVRRANHTTELGSAPLIRLLVANDGEGGANWRYTVEDLVKRVTTKDRLVAVAGLGQSVDTTRRAIATMAAHHLPMIGAAITADSLSTRPDLPRVEGLVRVAPTNTDEARAAAADLKRTSTAKAVLIQDTNPADLYSATLGAAFQHNFPDRDHTLLTPVESYNSALPGVANTFTQMMYSICQERPDVIYFAGRHTDLANFLEALPNRTCRDLPLRIVTGDDATILTLALRQQLNKGGHSLRDGLAANVTLEFTALAHPGAWAGSTAFSPAATGYFRPGSRCADCFATLFPGEALDDGQAIVGHDAVLVAVKAIRSTVGQDKATTSTGEIIQQWNRLHGIEAAPGASGWISLDDNGNPIDKAVPILALAPDGTVSFVKLSAPEGQPFTP
jgi:ABC-type branched-subunit amino acid transport system substrate-binding protein